MKVKSIEWRNIGPFGNKFQKLELPEGGGLWMVLGKNGHGKSFLVNLPKIGYYGKLEGFKKEEIANRLNKHGLLSMRVETSPGNIVCIERNVAPSDLKVYKYKTGEDPDKSNDIGKAGIQNYQDYIDTEVTGLPYHIFSNIISLSINDFKSFVSMTPSDKRIIIDKLFAMEVINRMNDLIRKDIREVKMNMDLYDREIMSLQSSIKDASKELGKLKDRVHINNEKRINDITAKMSEYRTKLKDALKKLDEFTKKEEEIKKSIGFFQTQKRQIESQISSINKKISLYNQDKCPTCETPFSEKRFDLVKGNLNEELEKNKKGLESLSDGIRYDDALSKISEVIKKLNTFIYQVRSSYNTMNSELEKIRDKKPEEFKSIENIISKNSETIKKREDEKSALDDKNSYLSILIDLYSDSGVKKKILESYLPTLNKEIEFTLTELHFPYSLRFGSDFEPRLSHLGIEINVETLSTGEKKRVDLAVLISIIRMLKRKYPSLNIFMLDEVLSSIDGDGIYDIIGLLQKTSKELKMNIFIINHSPLPVEYFSYKVEIQKNAGFSDLQIEKLEENSD